MGPAALPESDFSARVDLAGLPPGQDILYRVIFQDLADPKILSAPALGRFRTPPAGRANDHVRLVRRTRPARAGASIPSGVA